MTSRNKIIKLDADFARGLEGGECHFLSERTKQMALALMEYQTWKTRWYGLVDQDEIDAWVAQAVAELTDENPDCMSECYDFGPNASAVTWEPVNPYTEPDEVPSGYAAAPFTVVKSTDIGLIALGLAVGDVITDITRFPTGSLPTVVPPDGFARFRVSFVGREIELHLLQIPGGGIALISCDDDPLTVATIDLNKDIFSLPVETVTVTTHQIEFPATAAHFVDITFIPWVNDEFPFLNYGGGIRSFTVCGAFGMTSFDVRQNAETPCILEKSIDGETWVPFADLQKCPPRLRRNPGTGAWQLSDDGISWFDVADGPWTTDLSDPPPTPSPRPRPDLEAQSARCLSAANAENVIHSTFNGTSDFLSPTNNTPTDVALGVGGIIAALLFLPVIGWAFLVPIIGAMIAASVVFSRGDYTTEVGERLRCILFCNSSISDGVTTFDFDGVKTEIYAETGVVWDALAYILDMITSAGLNTAGGTTAIESADCEDCECFEYCGDHIASNALFEFWSGVYITKLGNWVPDGSGMYLSPTDGSAWFEVDFGVPRCVMAVRINLYANLSSSSAHLWSQIAVEVDGVIRDYIYDDHSGVGAYTPRYNSRYVADNTDFLGIMATKIRFYDVTGKAAVSMNARALAVFFGDTHPFGWTPEATIP